jgi:hypothetical protein
MNQNNLNAKEFRTKDLNEAGVILASGIKLIRLEQADNRSFYFVFEDQNNQDLCDRFWAEELMINAKRYCDALRSLKDRLFARR